MKLDAVRPVKILEKDKSNREILNAVHSGRTDKRNRAVPSSQYHSLVRDLTPSHSRNIFMPQGVSQVPLQQPFARSSLMSQTMNLPALGSIKKAEATTKMKAIEVKLKQKMVSRLGPGGELYMTMF